MHELVNKQRSQMLSRYRLCQIRLISVPVFCCSIRQTGRQDILTSTTESKTDRAFCRIEGTQGYIIVEGIAASAPDTLIVYSKNLGSAKGDVSGMTVNPNREVFKFDRVGMRFHWEADAVAVDIVEGKRENAIMLHVETLRVMKIMDEIRTQGGARFPQDDQ
jgi:hypothetical protein